MASKRVRIFAGPNGSGKSTLFEEFQNEYHEKAGYFVNADLLEKKLLDASLIDLKSIGLSAVQADLEEFKSYPDSQSLFQKASQDGHKIDIYIKENCIVDNSHDSHSYEGSFIASFIRHLLIKQNKSFCFETVMSYPAKIDEIKEMCKLGYQPYLYFVCIDKPEVNISRVANRVELGGHNVPEKKIRERYYKTLDNVHLLLPLCYRAYLFDNSGKKPILIAELYKNAMEIKTDKLPQWFLEFVVPYYN
ncbi:zeta toxin family protein [Flavobacterium cheonhonense]|jgi:predicted ABC-type ATPase|uniref:Zeta toxin family protein n=1 Tax=Flavobacterium cheonhonense TaxID=706185 RepID=A0ABP7TJF9_9FLAO|nr:zeta toxin family protein [Flavobacterium cheonhonense]